MLIVFLIVIIGFIFYSKKKATNSTIVEMIQSMDILLRVGIFTGIVGFILQRINLLGSSEDQVYQAKESFFTLFSLTGLAYKICYAISVICFLYVFLRRLYKILFSK